jgi:enediyne biosynthesis protein E4
MRARGRRRTRLLAWAAVGLVTSGGAVAVVAATRENGYGRWDPDVVDAGIADVLARGGRPEQATFWFQDVTEGAGIRFRHFPAERANLLPEDMGSGLAWGDYTGNGYPDLFLVNKAGSLVGPPGHGLCALYRNEGDGTFTDVTVEAGLDCDGMGMGAAWGDYNNNDHLDLFVTRYGSNRLYRNNGDGTFTDVTDEAGVGGGDAFSAGAVWGDYDRDGHLDLYVTNYVRFNYRPGEEQRVSVHRIAEVPFTLNPSAYEPAANLLYRNNGDGTFTEVAAAAGVDNPRGRSLGAVWADFNGNGRPDLYVANDISDNALFLNRGDGTFEDASAASLVADYRGAMGLAVVDFGNDGAFDIFVTNWMAERNSFFRNRLARTGEPGEAPRLLFLEVGDHLGLGAPSLDKVGWATGFADFDNDGYPDLWVVNGHTFPMLDDPKRLRPQPMQFFRQLPGAGFGEVSLYAWEGAADPIVGRGGAHADFDRDGRLDLAVMVHGDRPILLRNVSPDAGRWLTIRLRQAGANTRALGARVAVTAGGQTQTALLGATPSYLSQSPAEVHFGLGEAEMVESLVIHWPDGAVQEVRDLVPDRVLTFTHTPTYPAAITPPSVRARPPYRRGSSGSGSP